MSYEETPKRRQGDHCPHMGRHVSMEHPAPWVYRLSTLAHYLVISASISVLVLTFHIYKAVQRMEASTARIEPIMVQQSEILRDIHNSIHAEGEAARAGRR